MLALISVGISDYNDTELLSISCANKDALNIYKTFSSCLEETFSHYNSIVLVNSTANDFIALLSGVKLSLSPEDIFIFYFSGHGDLTSGKLVLKFNDADKHGRGVIHINRLKEELKAFKSKVIVILDCCYSGAALDLAHIEDIFENPNISVIASTLPYSPAQFTPRGSLFTEYLCKAIEILKEKSGKISLVNIVALIKENFSYECLISIQDGLEDIHLLKARNFVGIEKFLSARFLENVIKGNILIREMMWYSLMDFNSGFKTEILGTYFSSSRIYEPSWLVRRSIGSVISDIRNVSESKKELIDGLLKSVNWMDKCIGLIGARYNLDDEDIKASIKVVLESDAAMDAIWLANLYLSDSQDKDFNSLNNSRLLHSSWGVMDIWNRYSIIYPRNDLLRYIDQNIHDKAVIEPLFLHIYFKEKDKALLKKTNYDSEVIESELINYLYSVPKRGRITNPKKKWLLSILYGNWRDQLNIDLGKFLDSFSHKKGAEELRLASKTPLVEMRMSIFEFFRDDKSLFDKYKDSIRWGLTDSHPWVRRTAIRAFSGQTTWIKDAVADAVNRDIYPGILDLLLEAGIFGIPIESYFGLYDLNESERQALLWANNNEKARLPDSMPKN